MERPRAAGSNKDRLIGSAGVAGAYGDASYDQWGKTDWRRALAAESEEIGRDLVGALLRGLRLLECFTLDQPEMTLAQLVKAGGYSKTSTYRQLGTLEHAGWVERTTTGGFRLTLKAFQVGS